MIQPAAAGHDLHEVIADLAALDTLDELVGIAQTVDHCGADLLAHVVKGQFLQAVIAPDAAGADTIHFHPAVAGLKAAEHRLRHAAGDAEDDAAAGTRMPKGISVDSPSIFSKRIPDLRIMVATSVVVST